MWRPPTLSLHSTTHLAPNAGREIEEEAKVRRKRTGARPLGRASVLSQDPHQRPAKLKKSPAPFVHAVSKAVRRELWEAYAWVVAAYHKAAERLRAGDRDAVCSPGLLSSGIALRRRLISPPAASKRGPPTDRRSFRALSLQAQGGSVSSPLENTGNFPSRPREASRSTPKDPIEGREVVALHLVGHKRPQDEGLLRDQALPISTTHLAPNSNSQFPLTWHPTPQHLVAV